MQWSKYQEAFFQALEGEASLRVEAVAGSGKTTTSVEGLRRAMVPRILALAFNKKIAVELEKRLPSTITCKTMNSIGHTAWGRAVGRRANLDTDKLFNLATQQLQVKTELGEVLALTRAARTNGLVPQGVYGGPGLIPDEAESWASLADYYDIEFSDEIYSNARDLLLESIKAARSGLIDFDDQIYMSALFGAPFQQYDLVLVDEAQDLSQVQHRMLRRSVAQGGRLVAVGDSHQAIYGFRGASANSLDELTRMFNLQSVPLSISYRCPRNVVLEAQKYVPHIEPFEAAPAGQVEHWEEWSLKDLPPSCTFVCRNNAPLLEMAWRLIKSGRGVTMLGRDIGKGLIKIIDTLAPQSMGIDQFLAKLHSWRDKEIARRPKKEGLIQDKVESLSALAAGDVQDTNGLKALAERLFSSAGSPITLSSIHKAKGLEWPNVIFLDSWRIPSKYATQDWQKEQEKNCAYIAITRAQSRLIYADLTGLRS